MEDNQITDNDKEDDKQDRIELVQRAVEGDKEAFTNLYTLTYSEVYHIVKVFIHNEDTAQDIVQETYYKSLRKIKQLKEPDKFPVWIKKIAVNTAKAHLRKVDWVLFSEADGEGGKSIAELQDERLEHIPEIVVDQAETKELDEKQSMVVGMFYYEQMSVNEIAEALNCSVNTVKSRLNYARKKIGKEIAELEKKGVILRTAATGLQETAGNTENTDSTENTESTGNQQETSISETDQHTHQWVAQTEKIHHEASGHYETKTVQEAYEEPVYEYHVFCNTCGADVTTNAQEHEAIHNAGFSSRKIQTGSIHHDAVTQQVWVDEPAYDEVVTRGYVCSVCGAAK